MQSTFLHLLTLGLLAGLLAGCGQTGAAQCDPSTCDGCCDESGQCLAGFDPAACGSGGQTCAACATGESCQADTRTCAAANVCTPETDAELCAANHHSCGSLTVADRCGTRRVISSCGGCSSPSVCDGKGQCSCVPETNAQLCTANHHSCGGLTATDRCGNSRSIATCGSCASPNTCSAAGQCQCVPETDAELCASKGRACGSLTVADKCGKSRFIASCGSCSGNNTCSAGVCSCPAESNTSFCQRLAATCGSLSGTDLCGNPKSVGSCGWCSSPDTCGGGGTANACGCTPETNPEFCARWGKTCGSFTASDNCGASRTAGCGSCTAPESCGGGGTTNVCGCTPESNAQMCTRLGYGCGPLTGLDNCGASRTIANCGSCTSPKTCGGGASANVCGCTAETDTAFCARLGKTCGQVTGTDNCGAARTVTSCGGCSGFQTCQPTNVCGGRAEPMQPVCGAGFCWENPLPVGTDLWSAKTSPQGSNWVVGDAGTVLQWNGSSWRGWFAIVPQRLWAVWPVSDTEVWAAGAGGVLVHFDGTSWTPVASGTTADLRGLWGASDGTLWAVGSSGATGVVLKRPPAGSWAVQTTPATAQLNAVFGIGGKLWAVGNGVILGFDGTTWSTTTAPWNLTDVWGATASDVWAVSGSGVMRYTGTSWAQSTSASGTAVFGLSATNVWVVSGNGSHYHFDGLSWATAKMETTSGWVSSINGLTGSAADGTLLAVGANGALYRYAGGSWYRLNQGALGLTPSANINMTGLAVLQGDVTATGYNSYSGWSFSGTGMMLRKSGGAWRFSGSGTDARVVSPVALSPSNVWATDRRYAYHFDGTSWTSSTLPTSTWATGIAPLSATDAWVVGSDLTLRYDGTKWNPVGNPISTTATTLNAVAAADANHVWAGGQAGTMLFFDGISWSSVASGVTQDIRQLRVRDAANVLAAGAFGVIRWNGSAWGPTARTTSVRSVYPESASAFWVLNQMELKRWDGAQFVDMAPWLAGGNLWLADVYADGVNVWLLGERGELLRK